MSIWGTIYSYLFGKEIQTIYQEAESVYQESKKLQDSWVYLSEAPVEEPLLQTSKEITTAELQVLTDVLGEVADNKVNKPLYESFIHHVDQEIVGLKKMIDLMSQKFDELPQLESIREDMNSVLQKLRAKKRDLLEFKGRIILLAKVQSEVKNHIEHKIITVDMEPLERRMKLPPPPPAMPVILPFSKSKPLNIVNRKTEQGGPASGLSPQATMIELLRKGVKLRKLTDAEKKRQLPDDLHEELFNAIRLKHFHLRSIQNIVPLPKKIDLQEQLCLELKERRLTVGSLRKVSASMPVRKSSRPDSLQSQMEDILSARRAQLHELSESEDSSDSEWDGSQLFRPIHVLDDASGEDSSESSFTFHSSDIDERLRVHHNNTPVLGVKNNDKENDKIPMMFKMSEDESSSDVLARGFIGLPVRACSQEEDLRAGAVLRSSHIMPQSV